MEEKQVGHARAKFSDKVTSLDPGSGLMKGKLVGHARAKFSDKVTSPDPAGSDGMKGKLVGHARAKFSDNLASLDPCYGTMKGELVGHATTKFSDTDRVNGKELIQVQNAVFEDCNEKGPYSQRGRCHAGVSVSNRDIFLKGKSPFRPSPSVALSSGTHTCSPTEIFLLHFWRSRFVNLLPMAVLNAATAMRNSYSLLLYATFKSPRIFLLKNHHLLPAFSARSNSSGRSKKHFLLRVGCKLKTSKDTQNKQVPKKIVLPDAAPSISEGNERNSFEVGKADRNSSGNSSMGFFRKVPGRILAVLSNLPLAIGEMFTIAALMALGMLFVLMLLALHHCSGGSDKREELTNRNGCRDRVSGCFLIVESKEKKKNEEHSLSDRHSDRSGNAGSSSYVTHGLYLHYTDSSGQSCKKVHTPYTKISSLWLEKSIGVRRWSFLHSADAIRKQEFSDSLPQASIQDLGVILMGAGYEVFVKGPSLYAFKGLAGRFAPIGVHLAMMLIMGGATLTATGSFRGSVTVPQGLNFVVGDVLGPSGFLSTPTPAFNNEIHVNKFYMDYYDSGEVAQFHTDLSLFDLDGKEVMRKTISVNDPLRYGGITIYQTDWSISALQILKDGEGPFNLAVAPLKLNGDKKLFGTFLPVGDTNSPNVKGISMLARDLQSIVLYDQEGKFAGVRRPGSKLPIEIDGIKIVIEEAIGSSGLDLKLSDFMAICYVEEMPQACWLSHAGLVSLKILPCWLSAMWKRCVKHIGLAMLGVPIVYVGFGALMLTTCISYLSHSQIWALQDGTTLVIGGKTNRAKLEFPDEMNRMLDRVPEIVRSGKSQNSSVDQPRTANSSFPEQYESITSDF
ncbi:hypothetical protein ACLOJK_011020 [Asimina triloba]